MAIHCYVIVGAGRRQSEFLLNCTRHIIYLSLLRSRHRVLHTTDQDLLDQVPTTLEQALRGFNMENELRTYALCSKCEYTHGGILDPGSLTTTYPAKCGAISIKGGVKCSNYLLLDNGQPEKQFKYYSIKTYIAKLLSRPEIEKLLDESVDAAFADREKTPSVQRGFFDGDFIKTFKGPDGEKLYIEREGDTRLLFSLNMDFFNVNMVLRRNATTSCGIISMVCLNLPVTIRYRPEYMYLAAVIPGPEEPSVTRINHYLKPLIDEMVQLWNPGVKFSRTALSPNGKLVRGAVAICICDLPAARKLAGISSSNGHHFCSRCHCHDKNKQLGRTDTENPDWNPKDSSKLRIEAEKWRDTASESIRNDIFQKFGVRWSEMWRLPYWDPTAQLVTDPMHCMLSNLASNHFRDYLSLTRSAADEAEKAGKLPAFEYSFTSYSPEADSQLARQFDDKHPSGANASSDREIQETDQVKKLLQDLLPDKSADLSDAYLHSAASTLSALHLNPLLNVVAEFGARKLRHPRSKASKSSRFSKLDLSWSLIMWVSFKIILICSSRGNS